MSTQRRVTIDIDLYPEQQAVRDSDARIRVVAAGRRSGKTLLAAAETVERALNTRGWLGWWMAPGNDIAETAFRLVDDALPDELVRRSKESPPREIEFTNGSRLAFRTADGDPNVSVGLDWLVIDEAGKGIPRRVWTQDLRPTLSDHGGEALFISTPDGRGWFHDYWQRGQSEDYPDIESWRWSTYANPHVPDEEIDAAREELPERIFAQEYLAHFRDDTGGVFDTETATLAYDLPDGPQPHWAAVGPYRMAVDLARSEDYLAIVTLDVFGNVAHLTRERDLSWPQIQSRIERVAEAHDHPRVAIDATRDNKLVADLEAAGLDIVPVTFSARRKQELVEGLAAGLEAGEVTIPAGSILTTELGVFEYETTRAGNVRYGAPEGHHDDTVDALAMAYDLDADAVPSATISLGGTESADRRAFRQSEIGQALEEYRDHHRGPFG